MKGHFFILILATLVVGIGFQNCGQSDANKNQQVDAGENNAFDIQFLGEDLDQNFEFQSSSSKSGQARITSAHVLLADSIAQPSFNLYGLELFKGQLVMGGWAHEKDIGSDRLYTASYSLRSQIPQIDGRLRPLRWQNPENPPGEVAGYHVNDSTIVGAPGQPWRFMYYTMLRNDFATDLSMTRKNWVGFASSSDNGQTWFNHGPIIRQNNGIDGAGAWSPSALVAGNEIHLYYHTNDRSCSSDEDPCVKGTLRPPYVYRSKLAANGWQRLTTEPVRGPDGEALVLTNVDVISIGKKKLLIGNSPDLTKFYLYSSENGVDFQNIGSKDQALISTSAGNWLTTPHLRSLGNNDIQLCFSFHTPSSYGFPLAKSSHCWNIQLPKL